MANSSTIIGLLGLMPATSMVVANNAPGSIRDAALEAKSSYGNLIQVTDAVSDDVEILAALAIGGDVFLTDGDYYVGATITIPPDTRLRLSKNARILPTKNIDVVNVSIGASLQGGKIDILNSIVSLSFTANALVLDGALGDSITIYKKETSIRDVALIGQLSDAGGTDRGTGLLVQAVGSGAVPFCHVDNVRVEGFKYSTRLVTGGSGYIQGNHFKLLLSHSYIPFYVDGSGLPIATNKFYIQCQPNNICFRPFDINGSFNDNEFFTYIDAADQPTSGLWMYLESGANNHMTYQLSQYQITYKVFYDGGLNNRFDSMSHENLVRKNVPRSMIDNWGISVPFRDVAGNIAQDVVGSLNGNHPFRLYLNPTWGANSKGCAQLSFDGATQYGKNIGAPNEVIFIGNKCICIAVAPSFDWGDNLLHIFGGWYSSANDYLLIRKTAINNISVGWKWSGNGGGTVSADNAVAFTPGQRIIIYVEKDETAQKLRLYVNGALIDGPAAVNALQGGNSGFFFVAADNNGANFAGGAYHFFGVGSLMRSVNGVVHLNSRIEESIGGTP